VAVGRVNQKGRFAWAISCRGEKFVHEGEVRIVHLVCLDFCRERRMSATVEAANLAPIGFCYRQ